MKKTANGTTVKIERWVDFDDHIVGKAPAAAIKGRCTNCWGRLVGQLNEKGRWIGIECQICGRSVKGEDASREMKRMCREMGDNLPKVRRGLPAKYRKDAKFVLKVLPDMERDKAYFNTRIAAKIATERREGWLSRHDSPEGEAGPGYLYLQASAFMAWIECLPREMSVIRYSDYDFQEPRISGVDVADDLSEMRVSGKTVGKSQKLSEQVLMQRMGLLMTAGMTAAFACELALKAILITRLDEARKTHDLLELYRALPEDSKTRLKADFTEIEDELETGRHTFGRWRYFETNVGEESIVAMVNAERVFALAKAARVIIDEGEIAGLTYEVGINFGAEFSLDNGDTRYWETYGLKVTVGEAAIPWDFLLAAE